MSPEFLKYYADAGLPCMESTKKNHWNTWLEAQATLLSAHGPVTMLRMDEIAVMPEVKSE
jgi:hypothetical protein